jgi:alkylation response protein AidB-like acyl-CoA dehydrogenase
MPVERTLPTEEAQALLELTREIARDELAPQVAAYEEEGRFPRETSAPWARPACSASPIPRSTAGVLSRTRSISRSSKSSRRPGRRWPSG